jgi:hypothetical protein
VVSSGVTTLPLTVQPNRIVPVIERRANELCVSSPRDVLGYTVRWIRNGQSVALVENQPCVDFAFVRGDVTQDAAVTVTVERGNEISLVSNILTFKAEPVLANEDSPAENQLRVFPNPSEGRWQLTWSKGGRMTVKVFNLQGVCMLAAEAEGLLTVEATAWPSGIYLIQVQDAARKALWIEKWQKQ